MEDGSTHRSAVSTSIPTAISSKRHTVQASSFHSRSVLYYRTAIMATKTGERIGAMGDDDELLDTSKNVAKTKQTLAVGDETKESATGQFSDASTPPEERQPSSPDMATRTTTGRATLPSRRDTSNSNKPSFELRMEAFHPYGTSTSFPLGDDYAMAYQAPRFDFPLGLQHPGMTPFGREGGRGGFYRPPLTPFPSQQNPNQTVTLKPEEYIGASYLVLKQVADKANETVEEQPQQQSEPSAAVAAGVPTECTIRHSEPPGVVGVPTECTVRHPYQELKGGRITHGIDMYSPHFHETTGSQLHEEVSMKELFSDFQSGVKSVQESPGSTRKHLPLLESPKRPEEESKKQRPGTPHPKLMSSGQQRIVYEVPEDVNMVNPVETHDIVSTDVLCGRGGKINNHSGNQAFRLLVSRYKDEYVVGTKEQKTLLSHTIVIAIRKNRGRFLKQNQNNGNWYEIGDKRAALKTAQQLREGRPKKDVIKK